MIRLECETPAPYRVVYLRSKFAHRPRVHVVFARDLEEARRAGQQLVEKWNQGGRVIEVYPFPEPEPDDAMPRRSLA